MASLFSFFLPLLLMFPEKLHRKLIQRQSENNLRKLSPPEKGRVDFSSNDYLGYARDEYLFNQAYQIVRQFKIKNGATGSRLLSGNFNFHEEVEYKVADFHQSESALLYNSGYVANLGFFASVPQRGDVIFYDELIHASIRDALSMSFAKSVKFKHNDLNHLQQIISKYKDQNNTHLYIATESVFSMDGDTPDLDKMTEIAQKFNAFLVVDEAHALGVFGTKGEGLVQKLGLQNDIFARIMTYGKALGGHGASILGSEKLKQFLINFSRSFIYTTALSPHSVAQINLAYQFLKDKKNILELQRNIDYFNQKILTFKQKELFIPSQSAIQSLIITGNENVKHISQQLQENNFDIKPILSPTVAKGEERLRLTLHSYNSEEEIDGFFNLLNQIL